MFSCEICQISKKTFFREHLWATASILCEGRLKQTEISIISKLHKENNNHKKCSYISYFLLVVLILFLFGLQFLQRGLVIHYIQTFIMFEHVDFMFEHVDIMFEHVDIMFEHVDIMFEHVDIMFEHVDIMFEHVDIMFEHVDIMFEHVDIMFEHVDFMFEHVDIMFEHVDIMFEHVDIMFEHVDFGKHT